jgi:hypothetical protein
MNKKIKTTITISIVFTVFAYALIVYFKFNKIIDIISLGSISTVVFCLWYLIEFHLWKVPVVRNIIDSKKNISGIYNGEIHNDKDENTHLAKITIKQTWSNIDIRVESDRANSTSILSDIRLNNNNSSFYELIFTWKATAKLGNPNFKGMGSLTGTTILNIIGNKLEGTYFTDMQPEQTRGRLDNFIKENS